MLCSLFVCNIMDGLWCLGLKMQVLQTGRDKFASHFLSVYSATITTASHHINLTTIATVA